MTPGGWDCACGATGLSGVRCAACGRTAPWYVPPPKTIVPDPPSPRRRADRLLVALAVVLVLVVAAGLNRVAEVGEQRAARAERDKAAAFDATVRELAAFVERERGRPFLEPVPVRVLDDRAFDFVALREDGSEPGRSLGERGLGTTFRALGVETRGLPATAGPGVAGTYDEETRRVYVRGRELTPYVKSVIVHELTHAWQDQHLELGRFFGDRREGGERARGLEALVEGDAERVADAWVATQPAADQEAVRAAEGAVEDLPVPLRMAWAIEGFAYEAGPDFVRALLARGGNAAVDAAFDRPPTTAEQVLHVEKYLRREREVDVPYPRAFGAESDRGTFGEVGLAVVVARGEPDADAWAAVRGWAGDAYVTWSDGPALCLDLAVRMDTKADRERLLRALRSRLRAGEDAGQDGTADGIRARLCA